MAGRTKRVIKLVLLTAMGVVVGLVLHRCYRQFRGIDVCLLNVDSQPLRSGEVVVRSSVSTKSYALGDLAPAATACVWVKADNEASVDATFTTPSGEHQVIPLDGYIERGNTGWISAEVTSAGARTVKQDIDPF